MGELLEPASLAEVSVEAMVVGSLRAVGVGAARPILDCRRVASLGLTGLHEPSMICRIRSLAARSPALRSG